MKFTEEPAAVAGAIPKGFKARFEGVSFRQIRFDENRWVQGKASALNAHPMKLKFDFENAKGTFWLENGTTYRDFDVRRLRLRGLERNARLHDNGVIGLGTHQWLRLEDALIDEDSLNLSTKRPAWVVSPNMWLSSPNGLRANLNDQEVTALGRVRVEAFEPPR